MRDLRQLERKRLLKEIEYVKSDLEYKSEVVREADGEFMKSLGEMLEANPRLKELFDMTVNRKIEEMVAKKAEEKPLEESEESHEETESDLKLKRAYRDIAKKTHPDRIGDKSLNDLYIQASIMYDEKDVIGMMTICESLGIEYEIGEEEGSLLKGQLGSMKERISFMESTFAWKWHHEEDENTKKKMLLDYIKSKII